MIWLTWRQHRAQALAGAVLVALTAVVFLSYGQSMRGAYTQDGIGECLAHGTGGDHCQSVMTAFMGRFNGVTNHLLTWFSPLPGLIGAIVGASLLGREYEQGTWRLAWTQAVPRTRWLTAKLSWADAVGDQVWVRPGRCRRRGVWSRFRAGRGRTWASELSLLSGELLERLNSGLDRGARVKALKFVIRPE